MSPRHARSPMVCAGEDFLSGRRHPSTPAARMSARRVVVGISGASTPRSPRCCCAIRRKSPVCSCRTGRKTSVSVNAMPNATAPTPCASAPSSASHSTRAISPPNTGIACSPTFLLNIAPGVHRTRTCCVTGKSSSRRFSSTPVRLARTRSRPATMRTDNVDGRHRPLRGRDANKDQSYFCTRWVNSSPRRCSQSANCRNPRSVAAHARPDCRRTTRRIPPVSASSANAISEHSSGLTSQRAKARCAHRKA